MQAPKPVTIITARSAALNPVRGIVPSQQQPLPFPHPKNTTEELINIRHREIVARNQPGMITLQAKPQQRKALAAFWQRHNSQFIHTALGYRVDLKLITSIIQSSGFIGRSAAHPTSYFLNELCTRLIDNVHHLPSKGALAGVPAKKFFEIVVTSLLEEQYRLSGEKLSEMDPYLDSIVPMMLMAFKEPGEEDPSDKMVASPKSKEGHKKSWWKTKVSKSQKSVNVSVKRRPLPQVPREAVIINDTYQAYIPPPQVTDL